MDRRSAIMMLALSDFTRGVIMGATLTILWFVVALLFLRDYGE